MDIKRKPGDYVQKVYHVAQWDLDSSLDSAVNHSQLQPSVSSAFWPIKDAWRFFPSPAL